ncbi:MAG: DegT/DnrJ/EryC1/StrS family aminotransferase [bacterium]|nr:DegT/DnrJ/EryC1/StrS family aminotransferase [bacterium]
MIRLVKSSFYDERATKRALTTFIKEADIFSMGTQCAKFEADFARKQKRKFAVFVSSGSSANLVLIQALLNMKMLAQGDRVGFSALTWATNVMPLIQLGLEPAAIDCEFETLNVSLRTLKRCTPRLKAVFLTNVLGFSGDIEAIRVWCKKSNILLLEDNCEALGSKAYGKLLGNFSLASTFSFFVGHHLSTIEGGMICTDDEKLYHMLTMVRAHGWDRNLPRDAQKAIRTTYKIDDFFSKYTFYHLGYNARPTEISGFLGVSQLGFLGEIVKRRERNFKAFQGAIVKNADFIPLAVAHMEAISNFAMPVVAKSKEAFDVYRTRFEKAGVEIRPIIAGDITQHPFYTSYAAKGSACDNASYIHRHGFYFPNNPELTEKEVALLCGLLAP